MTTLQIQQLITRYNAGKCTAEEKLLLEQWYLSFQWDKSSGEINETELLQLRNAAWKALSSKMSAENNAPKEPAAIISINKKNHLGRYAAACIIFLLAGAVVFYKFKRTAKNEVIASTNMPVPKPADLLPGGNKAVLTLGNGQQIILDDAQNGKLADQGSTRVIKVGDHVTYNGTGNAEAVTYNSITTPKGGQYQVVLADGSKIWLNAASSLRFPTAFPGNERRVEIMGEAYFEIAKDPAKLFIVTVTTPREKSPLQVEVLGTHFNIMAYGDEPAVNTTLLEGSIKLNNNNNISFVKPGQQARLQDESIRVLDNADVERETAWKNGYFQFAGANLEQVMRQIARWYDVEISYEGKVPARRFGGKISRNSNASEVLKVLELSHVKFKMGNNKIIVSP